MLKALTLAFVALVLAFTAPAEARSRKHRDAGVDPSIHQMVTAAAIRHGIPVAFAHSIVRQESGYRCHVANGGSIGIMQVKPATARGVGVHGNLRNCATGLEAGMRYLRQAISKAHGHLGVAATLYNRGIFARPTVSSYGRQVTSRY